MHNSRNSNFSNSLYSKAKIYFNFFFNFKIKHLDAKEGVWWPHTKFSLLCQACIAAIPNKQKQIQYALDKWNFYGWNQKKMVSFIKSSTYPIFILCRICCCNHLGWLFGLTSIKRKNWKICKNYLFSTSLSPKYLLPGNYKQNHQSRRKTNECALQVIFFSWRQFYILKQQGPCKYIYLPETVLKLT